MLGSSTGGAQVAAALGLPFSFASHFAPDQLREALLVYRSRFNADAETAQVDRPTVMAGVNVLVAPTQEDGGAGEEARQWLAEQGVAADRIRVRPDSSSGARLRIVPAGGAG